MKMSLAGQCPVVIWSVAEKGPAPAHRVKTFQEDLWNEIDARGRRPVARRRRRRLE